MLVSHSATAVESAVEKLLSAEAPFQSNSYVSSITLCDLREDGQVLWHQVAKALVKWENHHK
jgi:hypothetical protein